MVQGCHQGQIYVKIIMLATCKEPVILGRNNRAIMTLGPLHALLTLSFWLFKEEAECSWPVCAKQARTTFLEKIRFSSKETSCPYWITMGLEMGDIPFILLTGLGTRWKEVFLVSSLLTMVIFTFPFWNCPLRISPTIIRSMFKACA